MTGHRCTTREFSGAASRRWLAAALVLLTASATAAPAARAQSSGDGYLFGAPSGSLTVRAGFDRASAGSDVFSFATDQLTLSRGDFSGIALGADLALSVAPRLDLVLSGGYAGSSHGSEFRRFVDQDDQPIEQTTSFLRVPLTGSVKAYLAPRGRAIGRLAWLPARVAPYVGAGGGAMYYRFEQEGDFVDYQTNDIYPDKLSSSKWVPTAHGMAGLDYSLSPRFALTGEARYTWAKGELSNDFSGFDRIDLSGISATAGIAVRF